MIVFYSSETWIILMLVLLILEMTLDGSMVFLLPLGVGCGITGGSLWYCATSTHNFCSFYEHWYMLLVSTSLFSILAFFLIRAITSGSQPRDVNNVDDY